MKILKISISNYVKQLENSEKSLKSILFENQKNNVEYLENDYEENNFQCTAQLNFEKITDYQVNYIFYNLILIKI